MMLFICRLTIRPDLVGESQFLGFCPARFARNPRQIRSEDSFYCFFSQITSFQGQKL